MNRKIIAVDFDGTIAPGARDGSMLPALPNRTLKGAREGLQALKDAGWRIIIWTCRSDNLLDEMIGYLKKYGIPYDAVNEHLETFTNSPKVYADVYVDDRNVGGFPGWSFVVMWLLGERIVDHEPSSPAPTVEHSVPSSSGLLEKVLENKSGEVERDESSLSEARAAVIEASAKGSGMEALKRLLVRG